MVEGHSVQRSVAGLATHKGGSQTEAKLSSRRGTVHSIAWLFTGRIAERACLDLEFGTASKIFLHQAHRVLVECEAGRWSVDLADLVDLGVNVQKLARKAEEGIHTLAARLQPALVMEVSEFEEEAVDRFLHLFRFEP